jgi:pyruvate dehydrogenase E2 component (dihydrolipoamide acetyltransferase)
MSTEVVMPQMGESITEGTVSKWLKNVGDRVEKDEPLLEISTDKVDAEVPSPGAGMLLEIRTAEGETVEVGSVVAIVGEEGEANAPASEPQPGGDAGFQDEETSPTPPEQETPLADQVPAEPEPGEAAESKAKPVAGGDATEIVMPQMGESITEGTVSKWLKAVGDDIEKDEPLLEISTDKVDAEVPSPVAGTLLSIRVQEGETVEVGAVLAMVGTEGAVPSEPRPAKEATKAEAAPTPKAAPSKPVESAKPQTNGGGKGDATIDELRRTKSSPLVRNIAREHGIDITRIPGSGLSGRVTKSDIMSFIETGAALRPEDLLQKGAAKSAATAPAVPQVDRRKAQPVISMEDRVEKMSVMRKKIAEHMTFSKQTSAHVTSVYEIDMTNVAKFRARNQEEFQKRFGTKLTFMPFIFEAVTAAIR